MKSYDEADWSEVDSHKNWYPLWILMGLVIIYLTLTNR